MHFSRKKFHKFVKKVHKKWATGFHNSVAHDVQNLYYDLFTHVQRLIGFSPLLASSPMRH